MSTPTAPAAPDPTAPDPPAGPAPADAPLGELDVDNVHWFCRPRADAPGSPWQSFSASDSARLEVAFRTKTTAPVFVKGGLVSVDIGERSAEYLYWSQAPLVVRRADYFFERSPNDWRPCLEADCEKLERAYQDAAWRTKDHAQVALSGSSYAHFYSRDEILYFNNDFGSRITRAVAGILMEKREKAVGTPLRRGYRPDLMRRKDSVEGLAAAAKSPPTPPDDNLGTRAASPSGSDAPVAPKRSIDEEIEDRPVDHLVFAVHGIGQGIEFLNVVEDVEVLRKTYRSLMGTLPADDPRRLSRVEFVPIQWRKGMVFPSAGKPDQDTHANIHRVMIDAVRPLRGLLSDAIMDLIYYLTPHHKARILDRCANEMNRVYSLFLKNNPDFVTRGGKVSVVAHSLGTVIVFDLLCGQLHDAPDSDATSPAGGPANDPEIQRLKEQMAEMEAQLKKYAAERERSASSSSATAAGPGKDTPEFEVKPEQPEQVPQLQFPVDRFFLLGSPLGMFLTLRGDDISIVDKPHKCNPRVGAMFNIFDPNDPVAFRIEPLLSMKRFENVRPEYIPYHKGGNRIHTEVSMVNESLRSTFGTLNSIMASKFGRPVHMEEERPAQGPFDHKIPLEGTEAETMSRITCSRYLGRLDYALQGEPLSVSYITAITAHNSYWPAQDFILFMTSRLARLTAEGEL